MEGIREVALARYEILPIEEKAKIERDFKRSVERGSVSEYFKSFADDVLRPEAVDAWLEACEGYKEGSFNLNDFITLKYITSTNTRIVCDGCSTLILERPFFSCSECLSRGVGYYDLCCDCYISKKFEDHNHQKFYDSYELLRLGRGKFAETKRVNPATQAYLEWFFLSLAGNLVEIAEDLKTHGMNEDEFVFDPKEALAETSRRVKELERMSGATEKGDSEKATGFMPKPHRSSDDLLEPKPGKQNEDEENSTKSTIADLLGVESSCNDCASNRIMSGATEKEDSEKATGFMPKPHRRSDDLSEPKPGKQNEDKENSTKLTIADLLGAESSCNDYASIINKI